MGSNSSKLLTTGLTMATLAAILWLYARSRSVEDQVRAQPDLPNPMEGKKEGKKLSQEEIMKIVEKQEKLLQPKDEDWKRLKITIGEISTGSGGLQLGYGFAVGVKPLLEMGDATSIANTKISFKSTTNEIETVLWGYTAPYKLKVDWKIQKLERIRVEGPNSFAFGGLELGETSKQFKFNSPISIAFAENQKDKVKGITISRQDDMDSLKWNLVVHLPYDYKNWHLLPCYAMPDYPLAVAPKTHVASARPISIMLFDVEMGTFVGEVPIPEFSKNERPCFALNTEQHALIGAGYYLDWLFYVDLLPYMQNRKAVPK